MESIRLDFCTNLEVLPPSIGNLKNLTVLSLMFCKNLRSIPSLMSSVSLKTLDITGCTNLKVLPEIPSSVTDVQFWASGLEEWPASLSLLNGCITLDFTGCRNLQKLPDNITAGIQNIIMDETGMQKFPSSIAKCLSSSLKYLSMKECEGLETLAESISGLKCLEELHLDGCLRLSKLPYLSGLSSLTELSLGGTGIAEIPSDIVSLESLRSLVINHCKRLQSLPLLPRQLEQLQANDCSLLRAASVASIPFKYLTNPGSFPAVICCYGYNFCNCISLDINARRKIMADACWRMEETSLLPIVETSFTLGLPGSEIPEWFSHQSHGDSMTIRLPHFSYPSYLSLAFCVHVEFEFRADIAGYQCLYSFAIDSYEVSSSFTYGVPQSDHVLLCFSNSADDRMEEVFSGRECRIRFKLKFADFVGDSVGFGLKFFHRKRPVFDAYECGSSEE